MQSHETLWTFDLHRLIVHKSLFCLLLLFTFFKMIFSPPSRVLLQFTSARKFKKQPHSTSTIYKASNKAICIVLFLSAQMRQSEKQLPLDFKELWHR